MSVTDGVAFVSPQDEGAARALCDQFYRGDSMGSYFHVRLAVLASLSAHREQVVQWFGEGVEFADVGVVLPNVDGRLVDAECETPSIDALDRYIQIETISLLHHAVETVLQLYTGLAGAANWLHPLMALTDRRRHLPDLVRDDVTEIPAEQMRAHIAELCLGRASIPDDERELAIIDNTAGILKVLADRWTNFRSAYNAVKHGLVVSVGEVKLRISSDQGESIEIGSGPSLRFLTHSNWENKSRQWSVETHWIRPVEASRIISVACSLIDSMWLVAVTRWSQNTNRNLRYMYLDPDRITADDLVAAENDTGGLGVSHVVFTEAPQRP